MFDDLTGLWNGLSNTSVALWGAILIVVTILPSIVAVLKRHADLKSIVVLNILFFWTWTVWLAVLLWAVSGVKSDAIRQKLNRWNRRPKRESVTPKKVGEPK